MEGVFVSERNKEDELKVKFRGKWGLTKQKIKTWGSL